MHGCYCWRCALYDVLTVVLTMIFDGNIQRKKKKKKKQSEDQHVYLCEAQLMKSNILRFKRKKFQYIVYVLHYFTHILIKMYIYIYCEMSSANHRNVLHLNIGFQNISISELLRGSKHVGPQYCLLWSYFLRYFSKIIRRFLKSFYGFPGIGKRYSFYVSTCVVMLAMLAILHSLSFIILR